jgi:hypothetical protein
MTLVFAKLFAKIGVFRFCENFREKYTRVSRKFSRKSAFSVFAKIVAKNLGDFRENWRFPFSRKLSGKNISDFRENFRENENFSQNEIS